MGQPSEGRRGRLIVFEGIDGSGKTTQMRRAAQTLRERGTAVTELREPTDGRFGRQIRGLTQQLHKSRRRITPEQVEKLTDLFIGDRKENVENNILPALELGDVVLLDRYYYSTIAYQGALGGDPEAIRRRNETFAPRPDLVLYFSLSVDEAFRRITQEPDDHLDLFSSADEIEAQPAKDISRSVKVFERRNDLRQVKAIYDELAKRFDCFHTIDALADEDTVARQVLEAIEDCLAMG